jgi:hypothetical protein
MLGQTSVVADIFKCDARNRAQHGSTRNNERSYRTESRTINCAAVCGLGLNLAPVRSQRRLRVELKADCQTWARAALRAETGLRLPKAILISRLRR